MNVLSLFLNVYELPKSRIAEHSHPLSGQLKLQLDLERIQLWSESFEDLTLAVYSLITLASRLLCFFLETHLIFLHYIQIWIVWIVSRDTEEKLLESDWVKAPCDL